MKLKDFLEQAEFLTKNMSERQKEKLVIVFEYYEDSGDFIKTRNIKHLEYDDRFHYLILTDHD